MSDDAATPEALAIACQGCGAQPGEPCRWGRGMTAYWGEQASEHVHFSRFEMFL